MAKYTPSMSTMNKAALLGSATFIVVDLIFALTIPQNAELTAWAALLIDFLVVMTIGSILSLIYGSVTRDLEIKNYAIYWGGYITIAAMIFNIIGSMLELDISQNSLFIQLVATGFVGYVLTFLVVKFFPRK